MLIYEKNNKLNINFDPSKSIEGTPDIQIGENEIKLGDAEITSENVLPTPTNEDVGKIVSVGEGGSYELVPFQEPTGTIEITKNGIVDVADYASANVNVPSMVAWTGSITITNNCTKNINIEYPKQNGKWEKSTIKKNSGTVTFPVPLIKDSDGFFNACGMFYFTTGGTEITITTTQATANLVMQNNNYMAMCKIEGRPITTAVTSIEAIIANA